MKFDVADDGVATYTTIDGDMVDLVAFNFYGDHNGTTELVYEANPGLAAKGGVLDAGVVIRLPYRATQPEPITQVSLWD